MFAPELDVLKVASPKELRELTNFYRANFTKFWGSQQQQNGKNDAKKKQSTT